MTALRPYPDRERAAITPGPNIAITYCRLCNWLLRAAWMGQELLSTFAEELGSVTLIPDDTGGVFEVRIDGKLLWSRGERGGHGRTRSTYCLWPA